MAKRAHYSLGETNTPSTAEARELQSEHELFDAFDQGLRCAMLAAKKIGYLRQEGRWMQIGLALDGVINMGKALGRRRQAPSLLLPDGTWRQQ